MPASLFHMLSFLAAVLCCLGMGKDSLRDMAGRGFHTQTTHCSTTGPLELTAIWNEEEHKLNRQRRLKSGAHKQGQGPLGRTKSARKDDESLARFLPDDFESDDSSQAPNLLTEYPRQFFKHANTGHHHAAGTANGNDLDAFFSSVPCPDPLTVPLLPPMEGLHLAALDAVSPCPSYQYIIPYEELRPH